MEATTQKTWQPTVAGILDIVSGAFRLISSIAAILGIMYFIPFSTSVSPGPVPDMPNCMIPGITFTILIIALVFVVVVAILSIIGGICAIQRKRWGLALAGSIAAIFGSLVMGILATILTTMAKDEFES